MEGVNEKALVLFKDYSRQQLKSFKIELDKLSVQELEIINLALSYYKTYTKIRLVAKRPLLKQLKLF